MSLSRQFAQSPAHQFLQSSGHQRGRFRGWESRLVWVNKILHGVTDYWAQRGLVIATNRRALLKYLRGREWFNYSNPDCDTGDQGPVINLYDDYVRLNAITGVPVDEASGVVRVPPHPSTISQIATYYPDRYYSCTRITGVGSTDLKIFNHELGGYYPEMLTAETVQMGELRESGQAVPVEYPGIPAPWTHIKPNPWVETGHELTVLNDPQFILGYARQKLDSIPIASVPWTKMDSRGCNEMNWHGEPINRDTAGMVFTGFDGELLPRAATLPAAPTGDYTNKIGPALIAGTSTSAQQTTMILGKAQIRSGMARYIVVQSDEWSTYPSNPAQARALRNFRLIASGLAANNNPVDIPIPTYIPDTTSPLDQYDWRYATRHQVLFNMTYSEFLANPF